METEQRVVDAYEVTWEATDEDWVEFQRHYAVHAQGYSLRSPMPIVGGLATVWGAYLLVRGTPDDAVFFLVPGILALAWSWYRSSTYRFKVLLNQVRRTSRGTAFVPGRRHVTITPKGACVQDPARSMELDWGTFNSVKTVGEYVVLLPSPNSVVPVPKGAFDSPQDADAFFDAAKTWQQGAKRVVPPAGKSPPSPATVLFLLFIIGSLLSFVWEGFFAQ